MSMRVNDFEPDQTTVVPNQNASEVDETPSVVETVKNLLKKNNKIIIGGTTLFVAAGVVLISLAKGQNVTDDTENFELVADLVAGSQKRQSPSMHGVASHQRRTRNGDITVQSYVRGVSAT
jgi:hypothetical protein